MRKIRTVSCLAGLVLTGLLQISGVGSVGQITDDMIPFMNNGIRTLNTLGQPAIINGVAVPGDFPDIQISSNGEPAPGMLLCGTIFNLSQVCNIYLLMLNSDGSPYFYKRGAQCLNKDFSVQPT
ncbi:hypothetical protein JW948_05790 [bacterium]|nr:hypothetical protein [bacterium]